MAIYIKCKEWNCLPNKGGLLDQDPDLLEAFDLISYEIAKVEKSKRLAEERQARSRSRR